MSVEITCPTCASTVTVIAGGFVREHANETGSPCPFVRTANSASPSTFVPPDARTQKRVDRWKKQQGERRKRAASRQAEGAPGESAERSPRCNRADPTPSKDRTPKKPPKRPTDRCGNCGQVVQLAGDGSLKAHQWNTNGRWCKAGAEPTAQQRRRKPKARRSVWATSGGLPTLGKH